MNKKVSLLILSIILAIVVFCISINIQKKAINYVPTIKCFVANKEIEAYSQVTIDDYNQVDMPISIVANSKIARNFEDFSELYLKDKLYKGQIIMIDQFDTKSNLNIFNIEEGKEKISIKVRNPENGVSYILKPGSIVNVYATLNSDYVIDGVFKDYEKKILGDTDTGYAILKVLSNVKILSTLDENGEEVENNIEKHIDTILISVTPEEAQYINLIREVATFNITEM